MPGRARTNCSRSEGCRDRAWQLRAGHAGERIDRGETTATEQQIVDDIERLQIVGGHDVLRLAIPTTCRPPPSSPGRFTDTVFAWLLGTWISDRCPGTARLRVRSAARHRSATAAAGSQPTHRRLPAGPATGAGVGLRLRCGHRARGCRAADPHHAHGCRERRRVAAERGGRRCTHDRRANSRNRGNSGKVDPPDVGGDLRRVGVAEGTVGDSPGRAHPRQVASVE